MKLDVPALVARLEQCTVWAAVPPSSPTTHTCIVGRTPLLNSFLARHMLGCSLSSRSMPVANSMHAAAQPQPQPQALSSSSSADAHTHITYYIHHDTLVYEVDVQPLLNSGDTRHLCDLLSSLVSHQHLGTCGPKGQRVNIILHLAARIGPGQIELCLKHLMDRYHSHSADYSADCNGQTDTDSGGTTFVITASTLAWLPPSLLSRCACMRTSQHVDAHKTLAMAFPNASTHDITSALECCGQDAVSAAMTLQAQSQSQLQTVTLPPQQPQPQPLIDAVVQAYLCGRLPLRDTCLRVTASGSSIAELGQAVLRVSVSVSVCACDPDRMRDVVQLVTNMEAQAACVSKELFVLEHHMATLKVMLTTGAKLGSSSWPVEQHLQRLSLAS